MLKLKPNKPIKMKFRVNITGTNEEAKARIIFNKGDSFTGYNATIDKGIIEIVVPPNEFNNGDKVSSLIEVMIGNQVYTPWKDNILFEESFKIDIDPIIEQDESFNQNDFTIEPLIEQDDDIETEILKTINEKKKLNKLENLFTNLANKK